MEEAEMMLYHCCALKDRMHDRRQRLLLIQGVEEQSLLRSVPIRVLLALVSFQPFFVAGRQGTSLAPIFAHPKITKKSKPRPNSDISYII